MVFSWKIHWAHSVAYIIFVILLLGVGGFSFPSQAQEKNDAVSVDVIMGEFSNHDANLLQLGLWFEMQPEWKIYWRSPGVAGYPPRLNWEGSTNIKDSKILWPVPHRFEIFGINTLGYSKEVVLPINITLSDPNKPAEINLAIDYLMCSLDTCITKKSSFKKVLTKDMPVNTEHVNMIQRYLSLVPHHETEGGFTIEQVAVDDPNVAPPKLLVKVHSNDGFANPDLLIESSDDIFFDVPEVQISADRKTALFSSFIYEDDVMEPKILPSILEHYVTLTVADGGYAIEAQKNIIKLPISFGEFLVMLGIALLGGFILNFMPCVLPVLSMKVLTMIEDSGQSRRLIRLDFASTTLGILVSFFMLAMGAIALKTVGVSVGWGMHFQQPVFIIGMSILMTLFACNMWGFFEIGMPCNVTDKIINFKPTHRFTEHFSTGVFATLLATPCSAPFVGTALSFALARDAWEITIIFLTMGAGLALPYILIALFPGIESRLPRPGNWLLTFKHVLGWLLIATVVWLVWILASQKGMVLALSVAAGMLAIIGLFIIRRFFPIRLYSKVWGGVIIVAMAVMLTPRYFEASQPDHNYDAVWQPFEKEQITELVDEGKLVFVDVTAEWCLTCKVNKNFVLNTEEVMQVLSQDNVVAMRWDWTTPNKQVDIYLNGFGRYGIPFNVVYGKSVPNGVVLPELLTKNAVFNAIAKAKTGESELAEEDTDSRNK